MREDLALERHDNNFDFMRFVFALSVLFSHSFLFFSNPPYWATEYAAFAVDGFFIISGFLVLRSFLSSESPIVYLWKRVLRIYPAYLMMVVISTIAFAAIGCSYGLTYLLDINPLTFTVKTFLFLTPTDFSSLQNLDNQPSAHTLNLSVWTLSYEFSFYVMIVFLGFLGAYRKRVMTLVLFAIVLLIYIVQSCFFPQFYETAHIFGHSIEKANQGVRLLSYFFSGMTMYLFRDRLHFAWRGLLVSFLIFLACMFGSAYVPALMALATLPWTYFVLAFAFVRLGSLRLFANHTDLSYGVYLYAWPLQKVIMLLIGSHLNTYTLFLLSSFASCCLAGLSWIFIEQPSIRLKNFKIGTTLA